jgi:hypothetical protein
MALNSLRASAHRAIAFVSSRSYVNTTTIRNCNSTEAICWVPLVQGEEGAFPEELSPERKSPAFRYWEDACLEATSFDMSHVIPMFP